MAEKPTTYPKISAKNWWLIRERFKKSIPTAVTPTFVVSVSDMSNDSARANVIGPLRELGLIDQDGKPTPLANRWRDDDDYKAVCDDIRSSVYPKDLLEAYPTPTSDDKQRIKSWFMRVGHVGDAAAARYTDTYLLLSDGDPTKKNDATPRPAKKAERSSAPASASIKSVQRPVRKKTPESEAPLPLAPAATPMPSIAPKAFPIHIDVQVHISPDTSADQIDTIFASMAKHLSKFV